MKTFVLKLNKMLSLSLLMAGGMAVYGQDQGEVPGDQFSLEGALELFKKSSSPEDFEKLLNSSDSRVNNLDLNGDGEIDYIKVIDMNDGNVHAFILQALVSKNESQDVAVIELEKLANGKAVLQITGDADVYGIETIIEPTEEVRINAGATTTRTVVNVWSWPSVQYVYSPYYYSAWVSPWGWSARPVWWHSWSPVDYYVYDPWWSSYRPYYSTCYTHRIVYAQNIYQPYRTTSVVVLNRHHSQITHYRSTHEDYNRGGRDRYDHDRNDGRLNNSSHSESNGRHSTTTQNRNSRATTYNSGQYQRQSELSRRSSATRDNTTNQNRSTSGVRSVPSSSQINSTTQQRQDFSNRRSNTFNNNTSRQHVSQPTIDSRSTQRPSSVQTNRRSSSTPNLQRPSGSNGGGAKSGGHAKRGRQ